MKVKGKKKKRLEKSTEYLIIVGQVIRYKRYIMNKVITGRERIQKNI